MIETVNLMTATAVAASFALLHRTRASPAQKRSAPPSVQDQIVNHLQSHGKIEWQPSGNEHYADVYMDDWNRAHSAVTQKRGTENFDSPVSARGNLGQVLGYAVDATCYSRDALTSDSSIVSIAVDACEGLIENALPPLVANSLRL